eukprot:747081-Hanusia_phi.AAC.2
MDEQEDGARRKERGAGGRRNTTHPECTTTPLAAMTFQVLHSRSGLKSSPSPHIRIFRLYLLQSPNTGR